MKKRLFSLFMSLIMVISLVSVLPTMTAGAANDSIQNAESYTFGSNKNSNITQSIDCRVYKFILPSSGKIKISYTGYLEYSDVYIYDSNGEEQYKSTYMRWNDNTKKINLTDYIDLTKGTYYFSVSKRYGSTGNYDFKLSFTSAGESFTETGKGTNNSVLTANLISIGKTYKGQIANNDDCDIYKFSISSSGKVKISYTGYLEYSDVYIYDSNGEEQYKSTYMRWNDNTKKINLTDYIDLTKGTYYFSVSKRYGCTGNYNFSITQLYKNVSGFKVASTSSSSVKIT